MAASTWPDPKETENGTSERKARPRHRCRPGLGAAISSGAAEQGARVILVDIDGTAAKAQADALTAKGFVAEGHALDVTDRDAQLRHWLTIY